MSLQLEVWVDRPDFVLDVTLAMDDGRVLAVVGPNGAGKSTLLRLLAGLPVDGAVRASIVVDEHDLTYVPAEKRHVGVAFQDLRLFPHLDASANVAFPLRARGWSRRDATAAADAELEVLGIDEATRRRRPADLSGGEAQRVALARALVGDPQMLLLDEPFAAVDAEFRATARAALSTRLAAFGGVTLVVTHDPADALLLGDHVLVLEAGRVTQHASPGEVARRPASTYAANLVGMNLLASTVQGRSCRTGAGTEVIVPDDDLPRSVDGAPRDGTPVGLIIAPSAIALHPERPVGTPRNAWSTTVTAVELLGSRARVLLALDTGDELVAEITLAAVDELDVLPGRSLWASVKATEIAVVEGGRT